MIDAYYLMIWVVALAWQWGVSYCFRSDEVFGKAGDWMRKHWHKNINTPLFDCPYCLSSIHGSAFFWFFLNEYNWYLWPVFIVGLTGLGALFKD